MVSTEPSGAPDCPAPAAGITTVPEPETTPMVEEAPAAPVDPGEEAPEEEMVDYEASPEHQGMDVNIITFSADYNIIGEDEEVMA